MKKIAFLLSLLISSPLLAQVPFWHQTNGPEAGTLEDVAIDSSGRVIVFTAGSGAFRSLDTGASWALMNHGLPSPQLYTGAATRSGFIIAANAAASGQVFRLNENDSYPTWVDITPFAGTKTVTVNQILADPDGTLYIAAGSLGILRSDDNGTTWVQKAHLIDTTESSPRLLTNDNASFLSIDGKGNLFAGLADYGAIFRTSDKGATWKKLPSPTPDGFKALSALVALPNGNIVVGTHQKSLSAPGKIYVSTDSGKTWNFVYQRPLGEQKNNIDKLIRVPGSNVLYANAHGPTLRSIDNGLTWTTQDTDKRGDEIFSMAANGNYVLQMCEPDGVFRSDDNGVNWNEKNNGMYAAYMYGVAINSKQTVFAITEYGLWGSTDNGYSWDHKPEYGEDYFPNLFIDKKDNIFIGTSRGLFRSKDDGQTLDRVIIHIIDTTISDSLLHNPINHVGDDANGKLFCATNDSTIGFLYSTNEGDNWTKIPTLPGQQQPVASFAFAAPDTILAAANTLGASDYYLSIDDGATWRHLPTTPNMLATQVLIHPSGKYLARVGGSDGGIFISADQAQSWSRIFPPPDLGTTFKLYVYMMIDHTGNVVVCTDNGIYRSINTTLTQWYSVSEGISAGDVPGHFIECVGVVENPVTHIFFAASHGLGVFKSIANLGVSRNPLASAPNALTAYPNPLQNETTISFILAQAGAASYEISDVLGRTMKSGDLGIVEAGDHRLRIDATNIESGNYMLMVRSGNNIETSWITIAK
jgi:photosystem II stability/assembly factor-like uncharacterized protein